MASPRRLEQALGPGHPRREPGSVAFTGNQLGNKFRWERLKKAGGSYDPAQDMVALLAARPADPAVLNELAKAVPHVEAEAETTITVPDVEVDQDRPAIAEGLDLTPGQMETARRIEAEREEFEAIQAALDAAEPGPKAKMRRM